MRKKIFLILCGTLSIVFLISYFLIYIIFRSVLLQEIGQQLAKAKSRTYANKPWLQYRNP